MLEPTIAPTVSAIYSFRAVPSTVYASASSVPSISALPLISNSVATTLLLKVAAPASLPSKVNIVISEVSSVPLKIISVLLPAASIVTFAEAAERLSAATLELV